MKYAPLPEDMVHGLPTNIQRQRMIVATHSAKNPQSDNNTKKKQIRAEARQQGNKRQS